MLPLDSGNEDENSVKGMRMDVCFTCNSESFCNMVSVDNDSCEDCTLVKVDSVNKPGILLEVVQILADLDLIITKAYISSDGGWFMDVFHVTDQQGKKITDNITIEYIEKSLGPKDHMADENKTRSAKRVGVHSMGDDYTAIEIVGRDRPGLLSEISAVIANQQFNVAAAEAWTHNRKIACVVYLNDGDPARLSAMEEQLKNILGVCGDDRATAHTNFSMGLTHIDRRLHQMLFAEMDNEVKGEADCAAFLELKISVDRCLEKDYSVVTVRCRDRSKLMFDIVCTLTDMQYVVFHATISSDSPYATQIANNVDYYRNNIDFYVIKGLSLELCAKDRVGLLSEVTRVLRENGLSVSRAGVTTVGEQAVNIFYVRDSSGNPVDMKTIERLRKEIGHTMMLSVKKSPSTSNYQPSKKASFSFGSLFERFLPS
ncbi:hypothetical protein E3N88_10637 [Mikania micrantha]|uniref:ACT domain-containing protein ACR n=1 Tax=Mikania micrantha TaxID=192012 RepID=A0A5N6PE27_9ASTR|nr:hypothetical protein E3N88_10637 [Mikania micrantha]